MSGILPELHKVVNGAASATDTNPHTLIAAPDVGRLCITSMQLGRTDNGTTPITVTLSDPASTVLVVPGTANGESLPFVFDTPLVLAPKTALTMTASSGVTTLFGSAQGFVLE
jgi:hypothetical protein